MLFIFLLLTAILQVSSSAKSETTVTSLIVYSETQSSIVAAGQSTLTRTTTSIYPPAAGSIPASYTSPTTGQEICYYVPYHFHVDDSVRRVTGDISASTPFNFYLMSESQYDNFVAQNPPCGSSYVAITLGYLEYTFNIDLTPSSGDYYILIQNVSSSPITYTVNLTAVVNVTSPIYITTQAIVFATYTSTISTSLLVTAQSQTPPQATSISSSLFGAGLAAMIIAALLAFFVSWKRRRKREERTRIY